MHLSGKLIRLTSTGAWLVQFCGKQEIISFDHSISFQQITLWVPDINYVVFIFWDGDGVWFKANVLQNLKKSKGEGWYEVQYIDDQVISKENFDMLTWIWIKYF